MPRCEGPGHGHPDAARRARRGGKRPRVPRQLPCGEWRRRSVRGDRHRVRAYQSVTACVRRPGHPLRFDLLGRLWRQVPLPAQPEGRVLPRRAGSPRRPAATRRRPPRAPSRAPSAPVPCLQDAARRTSHAAPRRRRAVDRCGTERREDIALLRLAVRQRDLGHGQQRAALASGHPAPVGVAALPESRG